MDMNFRYHSNMEDIVTTDHCIIETPLHHKICPKELQGTSLS
ncbi:hypothetical protein DsansV1_C26g0195231 [Dioscorea sansibarensis]